jgi:phosphatidylglycerol lysyltransferase
MIASARLEFQEDGAEFVSLSGAPLARSEEEGEERDRTDRLLDKLGSSLEPFYGFRSLHAFKASSRRATSRSTSPSATRRTCPASASP